MRTLGIDVGTAITGWSVIEHDPKIRSKYNLVAFGQITTSAKDEMPDRLVELFNSLEKIIKDYRPIDMAVEDIFFFKNAKTVIKVSQARGVIILAGRKNKLNIFDYTPLQVKQAVTGYGRAEKKQVQEMVTRLLKLKTVPKPDDIADAMAVGICHLNTSRVH